MKRFLPCVGVFLAVAVFALQVAAADAPATYTGLISDRSCGRSVDAACNKRCFDMGLPPVLVVDKTGEILEFENPEPFKAHPAAHVEVTGTVDAGKLRVAGFNLLSEPTAAEANMAMDMDSGPSAPVRFPDGVTSIELPFDLLGNSPYVRVKINGKGPFTFAVDTGSHFVLAEELAAEMGLDPAATSRQTVELDLGSGIKVPLRASFAEFRNLWAVPGRRVYGDIGYSVLKSFVAEFDYENRRLILHDPATYRYSGPGSVLPSVLAADYDPQFEGSFAVGDGAPIAAKFTLDTGAGGTVISAPLVKKYNLLQRASQKVPLPSSKPLPDGVNAIVFDSITARISSVTLGHYTLERPLLAISRDSSTIFATDLLGVNLGGNILRRFTLIIDYPGNRVILEPNRHLRDPFLADASGLVLTGEGPDLKRFVVHGVVTDSPAGRSGIKEGDVITAVDGVPADHYALWQLQELLKQSGKQKRLTIQRGGHTKTVVVRLRALA